VTAPRLARVLPPTDELAGLYARLEGANGHVHNFFSTTAHNPPVLQGVLRLASVFLTTGLLPPRERELVILRVAWRTDCVYEFGHHSLLGRRGGLTDDEIHGLVEPAGAHGWDAGDAALVAMADELCETNAIGDETWAVLDERWDAGELVELVALAGYYRMVAGMLKSFRVQAEDGTPGWPVASA
jgi:4-carboxymuconolactone decarboxylase